MSIIFGFVFFKDINNNNNILLHSHINHKCLLDLATKCVEEYKSRRDDFCCIVYIFKKELLLFLLFW